MSGGVDAAIIQSHWTKWTATGKKTSTLGDEETKGLKSDHGKPKRTLLASQKERKGGAVYISECVGVLCCALRFIGWITQGEDNWSLVQGSHCLDDVMGEQTAGS